jgi:hypothetical protein
LTIRDADLGSLSTKGEPDMNEPTTTGILAIQRVVASAYPSAWQDAIVTSVEPGRVGIADLSGGLGEIAVDARVGVGEPVAYHPVAGILSVGPTWHVAYRAELG